MTTKITTIAQALRRIKRLKGEYAQASERARKSVLWTAGNEPAYSFETLMTERQRISQELVELKAAIARANSVTTVECEGREFTLQALVFYQAELKGELEFLNGLDLRNKAEVSETRKDWAYDNDGRRALVTDKVTICCALPESKRAKSVDDLRRKVDAINDLLESRNHITQL